MNGNNEEEEEKPSKGARMIKRNDEKEQFAKEVDGWFLY